MKKPSTLRQVLITALCILIPAALIMGVSYISKAREAAALLSSQQAFDQAMVRNPYFQSIQKAAPAAFGKFKKNVLELYQQQAPQSEIDAAFRSFLGTYSTEKLKQASRTDLLKYIKLQARYIESLGQLSPDYIYAELKRTPYDLTKDSKRAELEKRQAVLTADISAFLATLRPAPPAKRGDIKRAQKNMEALLRRIPREQLDAVMNDELDAVQTTEEKRQLYKGYVSLYREMLKLPEAEAVELYNYMEKIPGTF